ncbi:MAG: hypothetical protein HQL23_08470, partial [Candidatus Omnitrophica bacterium]|nr:hypothetical protein [Candidatus Omnitrophota bacterium]
MFDIRLIRENPELVRQGLAAKNVSLDCAAWQKIDQERRDLLNAIENLRASQNAANEAISAALKNKEDPGAKITAMKALSNRISELEPKLKEINASLNDQLLRLPNL